jgi:hypothetical protein
VRHLRIFLSRPSDMVDEHAAAVEIIDRLRYDPFVRRGLTLEVVSWDRPGGAPILATQTPQASIDSGMPRPSECDIVVVPLWSRMGTPLPHPAYAKADGSSYRSGTEWEFEDAVRAHDQSGRPVVLLYRCTRVPLVDAAASNAMQRVEQVRRVAQFFEEMRDPRSGALRRGYRKYETVEACVPRNSMDSGDGIEHHRR